MQLQATLPPVQAPPHRLHDAAAGEAGDGAKQVLLANTAGGRVGLGEEVGVGLGAAQRGLVGLPQVGGGLGGCRRGRGAGGKEVKARVVKVAASEGRLLVSTAAELRLLHPPEPP